MATGILALLGAPAWGGQPFAQGVDRGVILPPAGIIPNPGQGYAPFWGGNTRAYTTWPNHYVIDTGIDSKGLPRALLNRVDITPKGYEYSGAIEVVQESNKAPVDVVGYVGGGCVEDFCYSTPTHAAVWRDGKFFDLHPASFTASMAQAEDPFGNVVGWARDSTKRLHPQLWLSNNHREALPLPDGFVDAAAAGIDFVAGSISGYGAGSDGRWRPIIWRREADGHYAPRDVLPSDAVAGVIARYDHRRKRRKRRGRRRARREKVGNLFFAKKREKTKNSSRASRPEACWPSAWRWSSGRRRSAPASPRLLVIISSIGERYPRESGWSRSSTPSALALASAARTKGSSSRCRARRHGCLARPPRRRRIRQHRLRWIARTPEEA
jgi:hypothetical protein